MAWVMSVLGAALALGGGYALWTGSGYIRLDWGQAETVAGTVALSAGIVTIGLAAVLFALRDLARASDRAVASGAGPEERALRGRPDEPAALAGTWTEDRVAGVAPPQAGRTEPAAMPSTPDASGAVRDLDEPFTDSHSLNARRAPAFAQGAPVLTVPPSPLPAVPPPAEAPTVVGRYEANGASYILFSDGTIEVETESGTHRFDSMAHLRDHIERRDAG